MELFDVQKAIEAQSKLCKENNYPHFAPTPGICYNCHRQIYAEGGRSLEYATKQLVTGCPFCFRSYCD